MNRIPGANRSTTTIAAKHDALTPAKRSFETTAGAPTESGFNFGALQIHPALPAIQRQAAPPTAPVVYLCSRELLLGTHAFFRVGGDSAGTPTVSLFPEKRGTGCWQGVPMKDGASDKLSTDAKCVPTPIAESALEGEFKNYPIGRYCARGPNSNTFAGTAARNCGMTDPDPPGWNPGFDDEPPRAGTFTIAASPEDTLLSCTSSDTCGPSTTPSGLPAAPTYHVTPTPGTKP